MNNDKKKIKFKNIKISLPSLSSIQLKKKQKQKTKDISSIQNESDNHHNIEKEKEKEEFGYELDDSSESNTKNDIDNNNVHIPSYINEKSNGENIELSDINNDKNINNKNIKKEFISIPITKINTNKKDKTNKRNRNITNKMNINMNKNSNETNNLISYNSLNNNNGFSEKKMKYIEVDNDWNNPKINFDGISIVSKGNSYENNFNDHLNIIDNNYYNSPKRSINNLIKSENFEKNNNNVYMKELSLSQKFNNKLLSNNINNNAIKMSYDTNNNNNNSFKLEDENNNNNKDINNSDIIDKLKKQKIDLEEKLQHEKIINKEKNNYIEILKQAINSKILDNSSKQINKNNFDLIIDYTKYKLENEKIKKSVIIQKFLTDDMQKELEKQQEEKNKLLEELSKYKNSNNTVEQKINEYEIQLNEIKNNENDLKKNLNKQKKLCFTLQTEINSLKQKNEDLIEINEKISKDKCIINIEEKSLEDYKKIIQEKNTIIKELKEQNLNLLKENDSIKYNIENKTDNIDKNNNNNNNNTNNNNDNTLLEKKCYEQIENLNNCIKNKELELYKIKANENNNRKIIDDVYEIIKDISNNIKMYYNNMDNKSLNQNEQIIYKSLKDYIECINTDNNGNTSMDGKLKIIKDFSNIIKTKLELLFNHFNFNLNHKNNEILKEENDIINKNNINLNNLFTSPNGQNNNTISNNITNKNVNNNRINNSNKKVLNNDLFKKIDISLNNFSSHNHVSDNNRINKYKNKLIINNQNLIKHNNTITQSNLLEKNSIIFKSNLSPLNKESLTINSTNKRLNMKYDDLVDSIFNSDKNKRKNNKLNLKVKELTELMNNNQYSNKILKKNNRNLFIKNIKKSKINLSEEEESSNTIGVFPSNKKIKTKNEIYLSLTNLNSTRRRDNNIFYKNNTGGNSNSNIGSPFLNLPIILNYTFSNNHKKAVSSSNDYLNKNMHIQKLEKFDYKNKNNLNNIINNKNYISSTLNTLTLESNKLNSIPSVKSDHSFIKIGNDSMSFFEDIKSKHLRNNKKKLTQKIFMKQKMLDKDNNNNTNTIDINGLANEVMKPTFLKNNVSLPMNSNTEKGKDSIIMKEIKKMSFLNNK